MNPIVLLRRAFASPGATKISEAEAARFITDGITEPAIQRYLAWRRALIFMVVIATVLSAGLTTYRNLTESDETPDVMESITEQFMGKVNALLPGGADQIEQAKEKLNDLKPAADQLKKKLDDLQPAADQLKEKLNGLPLPVKPKADKEDEEDEKKPKSKVQDESDEKPKAGKDDEEEKPKASEKLKVGKEDAEEVEEVEKPKNSFEKFTDLMESSPLYVLASMALVALFLGNNARLSFKFLVAGFLFGFLLPMVIGVCPWGWFGHAEMNYSMTKEPAKYFKDMAEGLMEGGHYLLMLLPTVLSLVPGVLKGCLKVKNLLPQSTLPGWFIVMAAPLYGLFLLVIFIAVDQVTAEPLVLGGMAMLVVAHFIYAFRAEAFTAPLLGEADYKRLKSALLMVTIATALAGILILTFVLTRQVMGIHLFGTDPKKALLQPIDLLDYGLEFVARSMFVTALSVDLFMRMNLTAWRHIRTLAATPGALEYQQAMNALEGVVG